MHTADPDADVDEIGEEFSPPAFSLSDHAATKPFIRGVSFLEATADPVLLIVLDAAVRVVSVREPSAVIRFEFFGLRLRARRTSPRILPFPLAILSEGGDCQDAHRKKQNQESHLLCRRDALIHGSIHWKL